MISIDIETYSPLDLQKSGAYKYAQDFNILLFGYAFNDEPVEVIDLASGQKLPDRVIRAIFDPRETKTAFNAAFERICLSAYFHQNLPPEQWSCTMVMAHEYGLGGSLEIVGEALQLPQDKQKLKTGRALIRYFSMPDKNGKRHLPQDDPERWKLFIEYNKQDVETERAIRQRLTAIPASEQELWAIDQRINDRGVRVDLDLAKKAIIIDEQIKSKLLQQAKELTGLENPNSPAQLKRWIEKKTGQQVPSINKKVIPTLQGLDADVDKMLDIHAQLSKTSLKKYQAMLDAAGKDGRVRGLMQFYGASRTGRWAGRLVQVQNLPQNKIEDLDEARRLVKNGNVEELQKRYGNVADVLSQLIRTAFIADGKFLVADFSAIEARILAWLASEEWRLQVFRTHGKIYEASAERMFKLPEGSVKKGDPARQKGKIAELALGYGGAVGAMKSMGALDMGLAEEELQPIVDSWRAANPAIVRYWHTVEQAARRAIITKQPVKLEHNIYFYIDKALLRLRLPSGRELSYAYPRLEDNTIVYEGLNLGRWERIETYGAKLVENIVQAVARDCLAEAMLRLERKGYRIVFHVHDEIICEGEGDIQEMLNIITAPISWAEGLPLAADAFECEYYRKD